MNYISQNQRNFYPNYVPGLNPIQAPNTINYSNQTNPQYNFAQPIMANNFVPNPVNTIPSQINPSHQILITKSNNIPSPPIQNSNIIQPQAFNTNASNITYNQSKNINNNLVNIKQNQIQKNNNINIQYNQGIKSNQVKPLYNSNINQNIINESANKNSLIQTKRKPESLNDHRPIPIKFTDKAKKSICKISYYYNNKPNF